MKECLKNAGLHRRLLVGSCVVLTLSWFMAGIPKANQEEFLGASSDGARDILLLNMPEPTDTLFATWHPTMVLDDVRKVILAERVKRVLSGYPQWIEPFHRERLARILIAEGLKVEIDPVFLAALIRVESAFSNEAVSHKGARGLMQVMPATGKEVAGKMGIEWVGPEQLHDPEINIRLGVYYLDYLLSRYQGNYRYALTAYNRGPKNLRHIVRRHGFLKPRFTQYFYQIQQIYQRYLRQLSDPGFTLAKLG